MAHDVITPTNIPIEISYYIECYLKKVEEQGLAGPNTLRAMGEGILTRTVN
jgi:hypothetical protein